jgi:hypothetical protein
MVICPACKKEYTPILTRKHPELLIQQEFPNTPAWQREQLLTGICSDKCWNKFLGPEERKKSKTKSRIKKCRCK